MLGRLRLLAWILGMALWVRGPAFAQADPKASAEALFREGREAMKRGEVPTACAKFAASFKLDAALGTLLNLGLCEEKLGDPLSAARRFAEFVQRAAPGDARRAIAYEHQQRVEQLLATIIVETPHAKPGNTRIFLDGRELPESASAQPIRLNPGNHVIELRSAGGSRTAREVFTVEPGESRLVRLLPSARGSTPTPASRARREAPRAQPSPKPAASSARTTTAYVIGAIGIAGLATGAISGIAAFRRKDDVIELCGEDLRCEDDRGIEAADSARTFATISTISFAVGAAGVGVAGYLLLSTPEPGKPSFGIPAHLVAGVSGAF
jgi:hypothetical protein